MDKFETTELKNQPIDDSNKAHENNGDSKLLINDSVDDDKVLKRKKKVKNGSKLFKCPFCPEELPFKKLKKHKDTIHVNISCDECDEIFENPVKLGRHKNNRHRPGKYSKVKAGCKICGKMITTAVLKRHVEDIHGNRDFKPFKCDHPNCSFSTIRKENLKRHIEMHLIWGNNKKKTAENYTTYVCKICQQNFPASKQSESTYIRHYRTEHSSAPPEFVDKEKYICAQCPEIYYNKLSLQQHLSRHNQDNRSKVKQFECKICKLSIFGRKNYTFHCKIIHNETVSIMENINCSSCDQNFFAPSFYIQHYQSEHGSLPPEYFEKELFICDQCPQVYISKISLAAHTSNVHMVKKSGTDSRRKKVCGVCGKTFKSHQNYHEHVLVKHQKKTPYKCDDCHRSFGTSSKLNGHIKLQHQRVNCDECGKEICNSFILKKHKQSVHGINPENSYHCEKCPKFFSTQKYLEKHVASKHT